MLIANLSHEKRPLCLSGCVRIIFKHSWLCHSCWKTNSDMSPEARVAKDSDGKSYTHSWCHIFHYILGSSKFFRRSSTTVTDTFKRSTASIKRKLFFNSGTFNSNGSVVHNRPLALKASEINSQDCEIAKRLSKQILLLCLFIYREEFLVYLAHQSIDVTMMHFLEFPRIYRKKRLDG